LERRLAFARQSADFARHPNRDGLTMGLRGGRTAARRAIKRPVRGHGAFSAAKGRCGCAALRSEPLCDLTPRERKVVQAIQRGKPNKIIAYELNMLKAW
jgi:DNA-binding NarL/FixJ family response regulator